MLSSLIRRGLYPLNEWREGTRILCGLRDLESTEYAPVDRLNDGRWRKLKAILDHAFTNVPFYRQRFRDAGLAPDDIRSFDDLRRIPPLAKTDLVRCHDALIATNIPKEALHHRASGGSTGRHTPFVRDNACLNIKNAAQFRFDGWTGWKIGEKVAYVWPAIQDFAAREGVKQRLRRTFVDRSLILLSGSLDEPTLEHHARSLGRYRPKLIRAFPNPLVILAKFIRASNRFGPKGSAPIRPAAVLTTGEPLLAPHRRLFEEVFGCPVFDCYASRECGQHACECEAHDGLHINADCLYLEFERDGQPVATGEPGQILVTDLDNYGMPFIRYAIEDVGIPLEGACSCGRTLPRMAMQAGRISDFVVSPYDGSYVSGASLCHYLLVAGPDVGQLQIVQDARDHLTIRIKKSDSQILESAHVQEVVARAFRGAMRVTLQEVDGIPHEKSGKYRFCINEMKDEELGLGT